MGLTEFTYQDRKDQIRLKLQNVAEDFIVIGCHLKHILEEGTYRADGHQNIYDFAMAEYGISKSTVSRFIAINTKFSVNGGSMELLPEYRQHGSGRLQEMLQLSEEDCTMIAAGTPREEIKELKQFRREGAIKEEAVKGTEEPPGGTDLEAIIKGFFGEEGKQEKRRRQMQDLQSLYNMSGSGYTERISETINPDGHGMFRKMPYFVFFHPEAEGISYTKFGTKENTKLAYEGFWRGILDLFDFNNEDAWEKQYGLLPGAGKAPAEEKKQKEQEEKEAGSAAHVQQLKETGADTGPLGSRAGDKPEDKKAGTAAGRKEEKTVPAEPPDAGREAGQLPGQKHIEEYPECLPEGYNKTDMPGDGTMIGDKGGCPCCRQLLPEGIGEGACFIKINGGRLDIFHAPAGGLEAALLASVPVNYCPACGRQLQEASYG